METCLALGKLRKARQVAKLCETRLLEMEPGDEAHAAAGSLLHAAAIYAARIGEWEYARQLWAHTPTHDPVFCEGLINGAYLSVLQALCATRSHLREVTALRDNAALQPPCADFLEAGMLREMQEYTTTELRRIERLLGRIVPPDVEAELGMHPVGTTQTPETGGTVEGI